MFGMVPPPKPDGDPPLSPPGFDLTKRPWSDMKPAAQRARASTLLREAWDVLNDEAATAEAKALAQDQRQRAYGTLTALVGEQGGPQS